MQTISKRVAAAYGLGLVAALGLSGCGWFIEQENRSKEALQRIRNMEDQQIRQNQAQAQANATFRQNLGIALGKLFCTDARVQNFLKSCATAEAHPGQLGTCTEKERNSVLTFMTSQSHVVIYLPEGGQKESVIPARKTQLKQILRENRLLSTEYLIFAHPVSLKPEAVDEAEKRGSQVAEYIRGVALEMAQELAHKTEGSEPPEIKELRDLKIRSPQIFPYRLSGGDIEQVLRRNYQIDRPIGREPKDLRLGVWVFRTDCHPKD